MHADERRSVSGLLRVRPHVPAAEPASLISSERTATKGKKMRRCAPGSWLDLLCGCASVVNRTVALVAITFFVLIGAARGEPSLSIPRVSEPPQLEDYLNGASRESEVSVTGFRQRKPGDGTPVSQETVAYLSYDEQNLYVVFVCQDEPEQIRARLTKREDIESDDQVIVYLDTFHDRQRAYLFAVNPLGIQLDGIITEGQDDDFSFDTLWHSEGRMTENGFVVRMSIPFKSLRFPDAPRQEWGLALGRLMPRNSEESYWPHITKRVEGFVPQFASLDGLERISPGRNMQFIPYGVLARARFLDAPDEGAPEIRSDTEARAGLDAKLVVRDALTVDVTLNPDFSQVESDEPQVTVNQRFENFFPERRPFFIENAGFFQTPVNLFFSRRIIEPQVGVRLTGKLGRWAVAGLVIDDRAPGKLLPEANPRHGQRAKIAVARVQREFGEQSTVGALVTSRDFAGSSNRVFALDTRLRLSPNLIFSGQLIRSDTRQLDGRRLTGSGAFAELRYENRNFEYVGRYTDFSPEFRSQLGFVRRVDVRETEHQFQYQWQPEGRIVEFGPSVSALVNWDRQGRVQDWEVEAEFEMEFAGRTELEIERSESFERFQERGFRHSGTGISLSTEWLKWLALSASYNRGTNVNFDPAPGLAPFLADETEGEVNLTLRPTRQLRFDQTYIYNRLRMRAATLPGVSDAPSIFNNHIVRSKLNYQFTRQLSLRAILDYEAVLPNASLVDLEREKRFTTDILATYFVNPGTALYVGYTDRYDNLAIDPTVPPRLRRIVAPTTSTGRQFFIKLSYLYRF